MATKAELQKKMDDVKHELKDMFELIQKKEDEILKLSKELDTKEGEIDELHSEIDDRDVEIKGLNDDIRKKADKIVKSIATTKSMSQEVIDLKAEIVTIKGERDISLKASDKHHEIIKHVNRELYTTTRLNRAYRMALIITIGMFITSVVAVILK